MTYSALPNVQLAEWSLRSYKTPRLDAQLPEFQLPVAVSTARAGRLVGQITFDENGDHFMATSARRHVPIYTVRPQAVASPSSAAVD